MQKNELIEQKIGKSREMLRPDWKRKFYPAAGGWAVAFFLVLVMPSWFKIPFVFFMLYFMFRGFTALQLQAHTLTFHEHGILLSLPGHNKIAVPREKVEHFEWEAEDKIETVGNQTESHVQSIQLHIAYEDEKGEFKELSWSEDFPPGTIQRLQRAIERKAPKRKEPDQSEDNFYDE